MERVVRTLAFLLFESDTDVIWHQKLRSIQIISLMYEPWNMNWQLLAHAQCP